MGEERLSSSPITEVQADFLIDLIFARAEMVEFGNSASRSALGKAKKDDAWNEIRDKYNSQFPSNSKSVKQIKEYYQGRKKAVKGNRSLVNRYMLATGGGIDKNLEKKKEQIERDFGRSNGLILMLLGSTDSFRGIANGAETGSISASDSRNKAVIHTKPVVVCLSDGESSDSERQAPVVEQDVKVIDGLYVSSKSSRILSSDRAAMVAAFTESQTSAMRLRAAELRKRKTLDEEEDGEEKKKAKVKREEFVTRGELDEAISLVASALSKSIEKATDRIVAAISGSYGGRRVDFEEEQPSTSK